jgi:uncharacterized protein (DUF2336 family)
MRDRALALIEARAIERPDELANEANSGADVLEWLAVHGGPRTRRAVAANLATPFSANLQLCSDHSSAVRSTLAAKIGRLAAKPDRPLQENDRACAVEIIARLASDENPRVRAALSHSIASLAWAPKEAMKTLALDDDVAVSGPVLKHSPLISDADLLKLIVAGRSPEALAVIARRTPLSEDVCDAIALIQDDAAVKALLENPEARIRAEALDHLVGQADTVASWHAALAAREGLPATAIRKIAIFLDAAQLERLADREDFDDEMRIFLYRELLSRRGEARIAASTDAELALSAVSVARRAGNLDEAFVRDAARAGQRETIVAALAVLAAVPTDVARRILSNGAARPVSALVRRAGLSMRSVYAIQNLTSIAPKQFPARRKKTLTHRWAVIPSRLGWVRAAG